MISSPLPLRVRYKDTDCMSVVYYGNYLTYFEVGSASSSSASRGYTIAEINRTVYMPVVEALVRYVRPARLDDLLDVAVLGQRAQARQLPLRVRDSQRGGGGGGDGLPPSTRAGTPARGSLAECRTGSRPSCPSRPAPARPRPPGTQAAPTVD